MLTYIGLLLSVIGLILTALSLPERYVDETTKNYFFIALVVGGWIFSLFFLIKLAFSEKKLKNMEKDLEASKSELDLVKKDISRFSIAYHMLSDFIKPQLTPVPRARHYSEALDEDTSHD